MNCETIVVGLMISVVYINVSPLVQGWGKSAPFFLQVFVYR